MLIEDNLILYKEMGYIVIKIYFLWNCVNTYSLPTAVYSETEVFGGRIQGWVSNVWLDLSFVEGLGKEWLDTLDICCSGSSNVDFLKEEGIFMIDVKAVLKSRILMSWHLYKVLHQWIFRDCKRLSYDDVIPLRKEGKCKLNKVDTSCLINFINTEKIDDNSISGGIRNLR